MLCLRNSKYHSESLQTEQSFCTCMRKRKLSLVLSPKFSPVELFKLSKALLSLSIGADEIKLTRAVFLKRRAHWYPRMHQLQEPHQPLLPLLFLHLYFALLCFFFFFFWQDSSLICRQTLSSSCFIRAKPFILSVWEQQSSKAQLIKSN